LPPAAALALVALVAGCASDPETATPEQPAPCRSSVLFQDLSGNAALAAIAQNKPVQFEGCLADSCFTTNIDVWERIDGAYVAKVQDAQRAEWQIRVTAANDSKMYVKVSLAELPLTRQLALSAKVAPLQPNERGLHRAEQVERKLVADTVTTLSNCE
jgi:hypothetical protein